MLPVKFVVIGCSAVHSLYIKRNSSNTANKLITKLTNVVSKKEKKKLKLLNLFHGSFT